VTTIITIPVAQVVERLDHGRLWTHGWGDWEHADTPTCMFGAIRYCQPVPGDAFLVEQVGARFGFGTQFNDQTFEFDQIESALVANSEITDEMLAATFGPQWEQVVALVRRVAGLPVDETSRLAAAASAASTWATWAAMDATNAATAAAMDAANAATAAAMDAASGDMIAAGRAAADAAGALVMRDLIGLHGFTQHHYDLLVGPWVSVCGPVHPDDTSSSSSWQPAERGKP